MGDDNPSVHQSTSSRRATTVNAQQSTIGDSPSSAGRGSSSHRVSTETEAVEGDGVPLGGCSFGERHQWLITHKHESIIFSRLGSRVRIALSGARCFTWGELAEFSDDDLRAVGVGERAIGSLHRDLERGPPNRRGYGPDASTSGMTLGEKYDWMSDVAGERIDKSVFDTRSRNALLRGKIRTWGDLAALSDASLLGIRNVGVLTVSRLHQALAAYGREVSERSRVSANTVLAESAPPSDQGSGSAIIDLQVSAEWASVVADDKSLGGLLAAYGSGAELPDGVAEEIDALLAVPTSQLSGRTITPLGELVEELLSNAGDAELLAARECSRVRPKLEALGQERNLTRERIRQKVAEDAKLVLSLLESEQFRAVRWASERLQAEFGFVVPSESEVVERWKSRLGEHRFEG